MISTLTGSVMPSAKVTRSQPPPRLSAAAASRAVDQHVAHREGGRGAKAVLARECHRPLSRMYASCTRMLGDTL